MIERVRAILVTADDTMLVIRRTRPGIPEYWVLPGGGVEPDDAFREAALHREIHEEIAGKADVIRLLHTMESDDERQHFYLARIASWSFEDRTGPEFSARPRGPGGRLRCNLFDRL
ncbi:NUDIX domain-containing protein [Streptomyces gardneri]|uniref:NUDIX hydrolase n=1 Tax=Streptomyces gardneri TaxID=66892 RepID=UPI0036B5F7EA